MASCHPYSDVLHKLPDGIIPLSGFDIQGSIVITRTDNNRHMPSPTREADTGLVLIDEL
jgi:hypothetical protein